MGNRIDLIGQTFGKLTVESLSDHLSPGVRPTRKWECRCECGGVTFQTTARLRNGHSASCGCGRWEPTHGHAGRGKTTPEYWIWNSMRDRCSNPKNTAYKNYGGRGISVCEAWQNSFVCFITDMGARPKGMTLEREDNAKGYGPSNCVWATWSAQHHNKRVSTRNNGGVTGVAWDRARQRWRAEIMINRKRIHMGRFGSFEEAVRARRMAELEYGIARTQ